jgi:c-di-GMP-binding flagellar brake protein YcgR
MTADPARGTQAEEQVRRSPSEIAQVLGLLQTRGEALTAHLQSGEMKFASRLLAVDPIKSCIIIEPDPDEGANAALLSRPRCTFFATLPNGHVEFVAADPQKIEHGGAPAIRLKFPDVFSYRQRREQDRAAISPQVPLECLADAGGVLSFKGGLVDMSSGGVGFLVYDPGITLEPGTVLKGCRIGPYGEAPLVLDLEVRYSELVSLPDGTRAERSGCRVVEHPETLKEFVAALSK